MVIPVYNNECNLSNCVTCSNGNEEKQGVQRLHKIGATQKNCETLCNHIPQGSPKDKVDGNTVTRVTQNKINLYWIDKFEERSAIYEYEDNLSRIAAEVKALDELVIEFMNTYDIPDWEQAVKKLLDYGIPNPYYKRK